MRQRALTLIEILIIVAIISILAAIAVPNFLNAQVRAKSTRMKTELATLSAGLESYYCDWTAYPPNLFDFNEVRYTTDLKPGDLRLGGLDVERPERILAGDRETYRENLKNALSPGTKSGDARTTPAAPGITPPGSSPFKPMFGGMGMFGSGRYSPSSNAELLRQDRKRLLFLNTLTLRRLQRPKPYVTHSFKNIFSNDYVLKGFYGSELEKPLFFDKSVYYVNFEELQPGGMEFNGRKRAYAVFCEGPAKELTMSLREPMKFEGYDPTNGAVSPGVIYILGPND